MTQIAVAAGTSTSVTIAAGSRLLITGQGTYRVGPLGTSQRPGVDEQIDTMCSIGPFSDTCTVFVLGAGSGATYEVILPTDVLDQTGRPAVSGAGIGAPSSKYKFFIPGNQFATSGSAQDRSGKVANAVIAAAYNDAATWANKGYITTAAGVEQYLTIPTSKVTIDLTQQSRLFMFVLNRAAPAGNDSIFGNSDGATLRGWAVSCRATGKLYLKTATNGATQIVTSDTTAVFCDGTDHAGAILWDQASNSMSVWMDGTLSNTFPAAWDLVPYVASSRDFAIGGLFQNAAQTTVAMKTRGLHLLAWDGGAPSNIGAIVQKHAANPMAHLSDADFVF